ncbi:MAG: hypothetical protein ACJAS1_007181 [Oleiphilaceae bacterium]|jgi:hypothetical protein
MHLKVLFLSLMTIGTAHASFHIDYQGIERPEQKKITKNDVGSPEGYRLLTDDLNGVVIEVGTRRKISKNSNFAENIELKFAMGGLLPKGWSAYVDEHLSEEKNITFSADKEPWLNVLARVGVKFGYRFLIDWDNNVVQISDDAYFKPQGASEHIVVEDESGQTFYIYKTKQKLNKGYMIHDGEVIPIKLSND